MDDTTTISPMFRDFIITAIERIREDGSPDAALIRGELETLRDRMERWKKVPRPERDAIIVAVLEVYRRAMELSTRKPRRSGYPPPPV